MAIDFNTPKSKLTILAFFLVLSLFLFVNSIVLLTRSIASRHWPSTTGIMVKSDIFWDVKQRGTSSTYTPDVKYTYIVAGKEYHSTKYKMYNPTVHSRSLAEDMIRPYPLNSGVLVYYSPLHRASAVLQPGITGGIFWMLSMSGIFLITICIVFVFLIKRRQTGGSLNNTIIVDSTPEEINKELMNSEVVKQHFNEMFKKINRGNCRNRTP
jgi:hypothetical protein